MGGHRGKNILPMSWSDENEHSFIEILYEKVKSNALQCSTFTKDEWGKINATMIATTKMDYGIERLKGKWNRLRKVHRMFSELLGHTGVTWDPNTNKVNAAEEVWQHFYTVNKSDYKIFKREGCKHYHILGEIFSGTTATGGLGNASTHLPATSDEERQLEDDFLNRGVHVHVENIDDDADEINCLLNIQGRIWSLKIYRSQVKIKKRYILMLVKQLKWDKSPYISELQNFRQIILNPTLKKINFLSKFGVKMESKHCLKGLMKSIGRHIDPEKEDQMEHVKLEIENKVRRILKLVKIVDQGNRDNRMKIKSHLTLQIEDLHEQYQSLYSIYEDLRGEVRKNVFNDKFISTSETIDGRSESARQIGMEESKRMVQRKDDLDGSATNFNSKIETLFVEKRKLEEQINFTSKEAKELKRKNSELEAQILELEAVSKQKDDHFFSLTKTLEENEKNYKTRIEGLEAQAKALQLEINNLRTRKGDLEQLLLCKAEEGSSRVDDLMKRVNFLQQELDTMRSQKGEVELQLEKKSNETSNYLIQIENLNENLRNEQRTIEEKKGLTLQVEDLELKVNSLNTQKTNLEEQITRINDQVYQSSVEKEELQRKLSELQTNLSHKENELSAQIAFIGRRGSKSQY
ncbi:NAB domain-containing protein [Abeliophyllum distichum]|uniref:NAB domain-containing protein n=1 Tax=Abeliophyllum distichum TaxID=126358 RepID=A0ABD1UIU3_9LAMI